LSITKGERVLLDTTFFVAVHNAGDEHRGVALDLFDWMKDEGLHLVTSDYVLDEAITTAFIRTHRKDIALDVGQTILNSKHVRIVYSTEALVNAAWANYQRYADKELSFTDCLLVALSRQERINYLVSFDGDFIQLGDGPATITCVDELEAHKG
jgi:predicted nucleic acid-binding protein